MRETGQCDPYAAAEKQVTQTACKRTPVKFNKAAIERMFKEAKEICLKK